MIKVVASDMDGTLLDESHQLAPATLEIVRRLNRLGIEFVIATGRTYESALDALREHNLYSHYVLASGAEVRTPDARIIKQIPMEKSVICELYRIMSRYPLGITFCTSDVDYMIGSEEEIEKTILDEMRTFSPYSSLDEILTSDIYRRLSAAIRRIKTLDELLGQEDKIYKLFVFSDDVPLLSKVNQEIAGIQGIVSASSMDTNLEITDIRAQKGPVLAEYIEGLGYKKEEVMVLGDSLNDLSMFTTPFGARVAMENAYPQIKALATHVTKSNEAHGVAYAVEKMLAGELDDLLKLPPHQE